MNTIDQFLNHIKISPDSIDFNDVMSLINDYYFYQPSKFSNGNIINEAGSNEGSCKIFAFAKLHNLTKDQTLSLFGKFYREDVLQYPDGEDHQNIRNFLLTGWAGINFPTAPLSPKNN